MASSPEDDMLVEAGFRVVKDEAGNPFFVTPRPCTRRLFRRSEVIKWLAEQHSAGRHLNISVDLFVFRKRKRKTGIKGGEGAVEGEGAAGGEATAGGGGDTEGEGMGAGGGKTAAGGGAVAGGGEDGTDRVSSMVQQLSRESTLRPDHKKLLSNAAAMVDSWLSQPRQVPGHEDFLLFKEKLTATKDFESLLSVLYGDLEVRHLICGEFMDIVIAEIVDIDSKQGPLGDFPPNINSNVFSEIINFGMEKCPRTLSLLASIAIRSRKSVMPSDVLTVASMFANLCYIGNRNLDGLIKMRSLMLQASGTTDLALDILSDMSMAVTSRSLNRLKDLLAEVGPKVILSSSSKMPSQSALDNLDMDKEHLMIKCSMREQVDTTHLSVDPMPKAEALKLFSTKNLLLNSPELEKEKKHLVEDVMINSWGKILAERRPARAGKLAKMFPLHHKHSLSQVKPKAADTFINKIYACQETRYSHMLQMGFCVQREHLAEV